MAAVDYARLRPTLPRDRLLFVAHREEILDQSLATFRYALRDPSFGEKWVGGDATDAVRARLRLDPEPERRRASSGIDPRPLRRRHRRRVPPRRRAVVRSAAATTCSPGRAARPDRDPGARRRARRSSHCFDGRIAAELRLWDAIDQQHLAPFQYFGIHDGLDLREVPWRARARLRRRRADQRLTADRRLGAPGARAGRQSRSPTPHAMRALGFCVSVEHARFMAEQVQRGRHRRRSRSGATARGRTREAARVTWPRVGPSVVFTVDLFNEGVDVPTSTRCSCCGRPRARRCSCSSSAAACARRPGRRSAPSSTSSDASQGVPLRPPLPACSAVAQGHRAPGRAGFPFLPSGCSLELDRGARHRAAQHPRRHAELRDARVAWPST